MCISQSSLTPNITPFSRKHWSNCFLIFSFLQKGRSVRSVGHSEQEPLVCEVNIMKVYTQSIFMWCFTEVHVIRPLALVYRLNWDLLHHTMCMQIHLNPDDKRTYPILTFDTATSYTLSVRSTLTAQYSIQPPIYRYIMLVVIHRNIVELWKVDCINANALQWGKVHATWIAYGCRLEAWLQWI